MQGSYQILRKKPVTLMVGGERNLAQGITPVGLALAQRRRIVAAGKNIRFVRNILHCGGKMGNLRFLGNPFTRRVLSEVAANLELDVQVPEANSIRLFPAEEAARQLGGMLRPEADAIMIVLAGQVEVFLRPELIEMFED